METNATLDEVDSRKDKESLFKFMNLKCFQTLNVFTTLGGSGSPTRLVQRPSVCVRRFQLTCNTDTDTDTPTGPSNMTRLQDKNDLEVSSEDVYVVRSQVHTLVVPVNVESYNVIDLFTGKS